MALEYTTSGAQNAALGSIQAGMSPPLSGKASPMYVQFTRSVETIVGIRWKTGLPSASTSASFSGSVVQYMYQICWPWIDSPA